MVSCKAIPRFAPQPKLQVGTNAVVGSYAKNETNSLTRVADFFVSQHFLIDILDDQEGLIQTKFRNVSGRLTAFQVLINDKNQAKLKIYELKDNKVVPVSYPDHIITWQVAKRITQLLQLKQVKFARY